jgi:hypothetical protein
VAVVLILLVVQGCLGAIDTLVFHELKHALPRNLPGTAPELRLHAARDFVYAVLFLTLPFFAWHGALAWVLAALLLAEIVITLVDFAIEDTVRRPLGGVPTLERTMHTVMAIVYGAFLALFLPILLAWSREPSGWAAQQPVHGFVRVACVVLGLGVVLSGLRDAAATLTRGAASPSGSERAPPPA